jgi:MFS family permease
VFLAELQRERGWSAGVISGGATLCYLVSALLMIFAGEVVGRLGPRRIVIVGMAAMGLSAVALTLVRAPWQMYLAYALMAPGWAAMTTPVIATTLAPWFVRRRGLAISLALNGASCGGVFVVPALVALVERYGFATAVRAGVVVMAGVLVPVAIVCFGPGPGERGLRAAGEVGDRVAGGSAGSGVAWTRARALRDVGFLTIAVPFALGLLAQVGFLTHQIAFLRPSLGASGAGLAVGITTIMAVIGRVGLGFFIDRLPQRAVTAVLLLSQAAALLVMIVTREAWALLGACALYGFSVGNLITLPSLIVQREFAAAAFGLLLGLTTGMGQLLYAFGPGAIGVVRDVTGGYEAALGVCIGCQVVAAVGVVIGGNGSGKWPRAVRR